MKIKKHCSVILSVCLLTLLFGSNMAWASPSELTLDEVYQQVALMKSNGATQNEIISFKSEHGINTVSVSTVDYDMNGNVINQNSGGISPLGMPTTYTSVNTWIDSIEQGQYAGYYTIYAEQQRVCYTTYCLDEAYPASYDVMSINWNTDDFEYISYGQPSSSKLWLADADQRYGGTVLFNVLDNYDNNNTSGGYVAGYVIVDRLNSNTSTAAVKFTHTFDKTESSTSTTGQAGWQWGAPLNVGVSYTVTKTTTEDNWSISDTVLIN
ncbi:hypothetical protein [Paenibacillus sp. HB172176]|uniref:hypothetical protein n=1 Tax=Paenibacillus sp. HB172176 TaxID=2493690 RepID=UPI001438BE13|nr:hypothetical protein [Paenibacillus sp. HB172176]